MKKNRLICILLSAILLCGCVRVDKPANTDPVTEPPVTQAPTTPEIPTDITPVYENMNSVAMPVTTEKYFSESQDLIYSYSYQTMYPECLDRDVKDKIVMNFTDRIEQAREVSDDILSLAEVNYSPNSNFTPYSYELQYNVTRIDQGVLSLYGQEVQIGGTPRANGNLISVNYDMVTGDVLTIGSILYHLDTKDDLAALAVAYLEKMEDIQLFEDFHATVEARFARDESTDEDFYFSQTGLCFYFAPYEIAPRNYGTVVVEIPYNELTGIIADAFFPGERSYTGGSIDIHEFSETDLSNYQQFVDVVAKENSTKVLLTTDSAVQDIRIYELIWTEDGLAYTQAKNIFASNFLSSENAIMLEAEFSTFHPSFMLSYAVNGEITTFYLTADENTGEITLEASY